MKKYLLIALMAFSFNAIAQITPTNKTRSDGSFTQVDQYLNVLKRLGIPTAESDALAAGGTSQNTVKLFYNSSLGKLRIYDPVTTQYKDASPVDLSEFYTKTEINSLFLKTENLVTNDFSADYGTPAANTNIPTSGAVLATIGNAVQNYYPTLFAPLSGGTNYIQNQNAYYQNANAQITGNFKFKTLDNRSTLNGDGLNLTTDAFAGFSTNVLAGSITVKNPFGSGVSVENGQSGDSRKYGNVGADGVGVFTGSTGGKYSILGRDKIVVENNGFMSYIYFPTGLSNNNTLYFPNEEGGSPKTLATREYVTANAVDLINNQNVRGVKTFIEDASTRKIAINNESILFTRANDNMLGISTYAAGGYSSVPLVWVTNGFQTRLIPSETGAGSLALPAENGTLETKEHVAANYASNAGTILNKEGVENYYQAQSTAVVNVKKGKFLEGIVIRDAITGEFGATSGLDLNTLSVGGGYIGINNGTSSYLQRFYNNSSTYSELRFDKNTNQLGYRKAGESGDDNIFELIRKKDLSNYLNIISGSAPTPTSAGAKGQIIIDGDYIYYCTATNTWARTPLETTW